MVTKPARMYSKISGPAYTRKEFMGGVPYPKTFPGFGRALVACAMLRTVHLIGSSSIVRFPFLSEDVARIIANSGVVARLNPDIATVDLSRIHEKNSTFPSLTNSGRIIDNHNVW